MSRVVAPLTVTKINQTKPGEKLIKLADGGGLALWIYPTGARVWRMSYLRPSDRKPDGLKIGDYPTMSLAQARERREAVRADLAAGNNPKLSEYRRQVYATDPTFKETAESWFERWRDTVTEDYAEQVWRMLDANIFPHLGAFPVKDITSRMLVDALAPMEARGALVYLRRAKSAVSMVCGHALAKGLVENNVAVGISAAFRSAPKRNFRALKPEQLPELVAAIEGADITIVTRYLLKWQLLTLVRPGEAAAARWDEIEDGVWRIPAEKMKRRRDHLVPLSTGALEVLAAMRDISGHREYIFPSRTNPKVHCNASTANMALKRGAVQTTAHGLRALASTALHEAGFESRVIEMALAHVDQNETRAAYNRAEYLPQRSEMLEWWSAQIAKGRADIKRHDSPPGGL
ncbi:tyrosine-type recombinase/integrase [Vogesella oryzae]|uniref:tyrosine-type recombinase/integrase n=1 Tax=Vogesella oryzae TaxID=1735285 RepID=UPI0015836F00|nr:tyrosine-type recombinase/integrase [Vogesella oryzae]